MGSYIFMNIISGCARNLTLADLPDSEVRPTAIRARKALFDSIGSFEGKGILDICSGSGALALEAASRGAKWAAMVEKDPIHVECIKENCRRVAAAGCESSLLILNFDAVNFSRYMFQLPEKAAVIFGDPPYKISAEIFHSLLNDKSFTDFNADALLIWEIPATPGAMGGFINVNHLKNMRFRRFGSTVFLLGEIE